jgi:hypothetical protein
MPFNLYEEEENPTFGMSTHLMPVITEHWVTYKLVLRDKYGNALLRPYEYPNTINPFSAFLTNNDLDRDHSFSWGDFQIS